MRSARRLPVGAEPLPEGGVHFRVWAPRARRVEVAFEDDRVPATALPEESGGFFSGHVTSASVGACYRYRLDGGPTAYPDPASRFQPEGPHGPSEIIDPSQFSWSDADWRGLSLEGQVFYEMHIGTFTSAGTWAAAEPQLPALADLGITVLEVMPVADFVGRFGWGYDGVDLFAPTRLYGRPDDFRRFVNRAHAVGLGVILDVVCNHLGPDGNYLPAFSEHYFTDRYRTDWGQAINFEDEHSGPVREFFVANAGYWIDEFHLDGLRLDATQDIHDSSADHILAAIARRARQVAGPRSIVLVGEDERQRVTLVRAPEGGGYGLDALWNDDFHHSAMVALTGHNEAYYSDHLGQPQEFISAAKYGYLFQGQWYAWQGKRRGSPTFGLRPAKFVTFIQNHDQIANSARGERIHLLTNPGRHRAVTALLLLGPGTPLLFQGQEFSASSPFLYFADQKPKLTELIRKGRAEFLRQFRSLAEPKIQTCLPDPADPGTWKRCQLDLSERERNAKAYALHRDLIWLRRQDAVFRTQRLGGVDGAVLSVGAFVLRFFGVEGDDRLLLVNLGRDLQLSPAPEPLLAPPEDRTWMLVWSSEDARYGGHGTAPVESEEGWRVPGEAAVVLGPGPPAVRPRSSRWRR